VKGERQSGFRNHTEAEKTAPQYLPGRTAATGSHSRKPNQFGQAGHQPGHQQIELPDAPAIKGGKHPQVRNQGGMTRKR